jgi:hypothetical protein
MKNAAAYSAREREHWLIQAALTVPLLAQQRIPILHRGQLPPLHPKVIRQKLEHQPLLLVPRRLAPEAVHHLFLAQRKENERARGRIALVVRHEPVSRNGFELRFLPVSAGAAAAASAR